MLPWPAQHVPRCLLEAGNQPLVLHMVSATTDLPAHIKKCMYALHSDIFHFMHSWSITIYSYHIKLGPVCTIFKSWRPHSFIMLCPCSIQGLLAGSNDYEELERGSIRDINRHYYRCAGRPEALVRLVNSFHCPQLLLLLPVLSLSGKKGTARRQRLLR